MSNAYLLNVEYPVVHVGDTWRSGTGNDVPQVERLTLGISDCDVNNLAHVVLEEQAAVQVVVHLLICKENIDKCHHPANFIIRLSLIST